MILNAPPMGDVHTKNQRPVSKNGLVRAGLRLKSVKNAVFRPFLKKCRKGDVIRSQQNLGLPGFKCRRRFSEILGPFGWITASHGFGSPQKVQFFTVFLLFLTQNSHRWPKEVSQSAGNWILIIFLFLVTSLARLEADISIPAPSYTNPNVTPLCDDWVGRGGRAEGYHERD